MKKGFTLIELIVVIIIIGILATLGFAQYQRMIERARGAEARSVLGAIRTQAAALWIENHSPGTAPTVATTLFVNTNLGLGSEVGHIPTACASAGSSVGYFFRYNVGTTTSTGFTATATRCTVTGKNPPASAQDSLQLITDFQAGTDQWVGSY